jgi:hypothetical protein
MLENKELIINIVGLWVMTSYTLVVAPSFRRNILLPSTVNINPHGRGSLKSHEEHLNVRSSANMFNADQGSRVMVSKLRSWAGSLGLQAEFCWERS